MVLVRQEIGDVLRDVRLQKGHTLRQVASKASVALGYLSEVERGQKEASSEILSAIADALEVPVSGILIEAATEVVQSGGYYANGYYYPGATVTTVTVTSAPVVTTTTEVFEDSVTYTKPVVRKAVRKWHPKPKAKCVCG